MSPPISQSKCWGTDPNRNFDIAHGSVGSSDDYCQDTYHGDRPFSEAESQAVRTALTDIIANHGGVKNVVYVSIHAFSQLWMYPNGYTKAKSQNHLDLKRVAAKAVSALRYVQVLGRRANLQFQFCDTQILREIKVCNCRRYETPTLVILEDQNFDLEKICL